MIRVGVGGWTYAPWRGSFYPKGLPAKRELEYMSRKLSSIEINGTFYRTQTPASFAKWRDETPDDFIFSVKASRYATNRPALAEAGGSIERFFASGLTELGTKLGPVLWQFSPYKRFEAEDFERFLATLPRELAGVRLRHALDVRHKSFSVPEFVALARRFDCAIVFSDTDEYPSFADLTTDFVYARLMRSAEEEDAGYSAGSLDAWVQRVRQWERGEDPSDLPRIEKIQAPSIARDVFVYFISGAKERAPAGAVALLDRLAR